jgi:hypothetical protein
MHGYVPDKLLNKFDYNCPGEKHLSLAFWQTPNQFSLAYLVHKQLPRALFYGFSLSFLGVCILVGTFRPKKQMPGDYLQVLGSSAPERMSFAHVAA